MNRNEMLKEKITARRREIRAIDKEIEKEQEELLEVKIERISAGEIARYKRASLMEDLERAEAARKNM
ncbi:hypothetical protein RyT2_14120 [Pseudolactococcus yaeyamensis]